MEEKLLTLYAKTKRQEARMLMYAIRAQKDQNKALKQLCEALSISMKAQARRILLQIKGYVSSTSRNVENLQSVELPELIAMHKEIAELAAGKNKALEIGSAHSLKINTLNQSILRQAENGNKIQCYHICNFCGYISSDRVPERCPICIASPDRFIEVAQ
jgi:rubrerythrin